MKGVDQIERLGALDIPSASATRVAEAAGWIQQLRGYLDAKEGELARRAGQLHAEGDGIPPEDLLTRHGRSSRRTAEKTTRRAELLGDAPELNRQLSTGRIGPEHADAVVAVAGRLPDDQRAALLAREADLAAAAASKSPEQFRRFVSQAADRLAADDGIDRSERQRDAASVSLGVSDHNGMGYIRGDLHPDDYQSIRRAIEGEVAALRKLPEYERLRIDQLNAIALKNLTTGARSNQRRNRPELMVLVDLDTIAHGPHDQGVCEYSDGTPLPVETVRRHACEADIIPVVLGGEGLPLDVGRASRLATPGQRAALRAMYRTCAIDGCEHSFDVCEIHHLIEWAIERGETDLVNLLPLCPYHHHRAHEGRWRLELDPVTRELSVWLPSGVLHGRCLPDLVADRTAGVAA